MKHLKHIILVVAVVTAYMSHAQYNEEVAGKNRIFKKEIQEVAVVDEAGEEVKDADGYLITKMVEVKVLADSDKHGNAEGSQYDLATDGAFEGNTVAVLNLVGISLSEPEKALKQKGLSLFQWSKGAPSPEVLKSELKKACQLWVISGGNLQLTEEHVDVIEEFFNSGKGLYIWGDNQPLYADANLITKRLFNTTMNGDTHAGQVVGISGESEGRTGIVDGHLISTGVVNMYEGITIATVTATQELNPLIYNSSNELVAAVYEKDGKRCIIDGGFTRLFYNWNSAGTDRYIKNAAAWLVNYERFGDEVYLELENNDEKINEVAEETDELEIIINPMEWNEQISITNQLKN